MNKQEQTFNAFAQLSDFMATNQEPKRVIVMHPSLLERAREWLTIYTDLNDEQEIRFDSTVPVYLSYAVPKDYFFTPTKEMYDSMFKDGKCMKMEELTKILKND